MTRLPLRMSRQQRALLRSAGRRAWRRAARVKPLRRGLTESSKTAAQWLASAMTRSTSERCALWRASSACQGCRGWGSPRSAHHLLPPPQSRPARSLRGSVHATREVRCRHRGLLCLRTRGANPRYAGLPLRPHRIQFRSHSIGDSARASDVRTTTSGVSDRGRTPAQPTDALAHRLAVRLEFTRDVTSRTHASDSATDLPCLGARSLIQ